MTTGADKELVDAKNRVPGLVIESVTLCHSNKAGAVGRLENETIQRTTESENYAHGNIDMTIALTPFSCYSSADHTHLSVISCGFFSKFTQQHQAYDLYKVILCI